MSNIYHVLSIAGSDSCGGAGIQADLKTAMGLSCHCCTVIVVVTAQNTKEIKKIIELEENFIIDQLDSVFEDIQINVVKLGVLYSRKIANLICTYLKNINKKSEKKLSIVFDPVFVASVGSSLIQNVQDIKYMLKIICPISLIITPNFSECKTILKTLDISTDTDIINTSIVNLCKTITEKLNITACLLKNIDINQLNGHTTPINIHEQTKKHYAIDYLCLRKCKTTLKEDINKQTLIKNDPLNNSNSNLEENTFFLYDVYELKTIRLPQTDIHGTGCTISTAISCFLSKKYDILQSCIESKKYIYNCIKHAYELGSNSFGLNHLTASQEQNKVNKKDDIQVTLLASDLV
ncbi:phosphomethylpyrimidine kinase, putative [Hepatocystis sp. ex Piliocolobus tephrosceles]|nr:phosphomethylpyrimidine kinase, putative [Hepatocystis sp. ex Piliocolobus tephrosceles]